MKKLVTVLTAAVLLFSTSAFAGQGDSNVSPRVKSAFLTDFARASGVTWERTNDFYFATFNMNNVEVNAAYNEQGELVGTSRSVEIDQLPMNLSLALSKRYEGYTTSKKALELNFEGDTRYYLTVANDKIALKLKCSTSGTMEVERKIRKL